MSLNDDVEIINGNNENHQDTRNDNQRAASRRRVIRFPADNSMRTSPFFNSIHFNEISLEALETDNAISLNLNFTFLDCVIQRVITPAPQSHTALFVEEVKMLKMMRVSLVCSFVLLFLKGMLQ